MTSLKTFAKYGVARLLLLLCFFSTIATTAQTVVTIGTGTTATSGSPIYTLFNYSASETLYLGTEITATGNITKLAYQKATGASTTAPNVKIYMKHTALTNLGNSGYTVTNAGFAGYTLVYDGTLPNAATSGWMEVNFNTPFNYNPANGNLSVLITNSTPITGGRPNYTYTTQASGARKTATYSNDSTPWNSTVTMQPVPERPNTRLTLVPATGCVSPAALAVNSITATGATLTWAAPATGNTPQGYDYEVRTAGTGGSGTTGLITAGTTTATTAAITNLNANSAYTVYVRTNCGTDTYSTWTPLLFTTACGALSIPYTQGFEAGLACGTIQDVNNDAKTWAISTSAANTGSNGLRYTYATAAMANDWYITPAINVTAGTAYKITFTYRCYQASNTEALEVKTGTAQTAAGMVQTLYTNTAITNSTYATATILYNATATGTQYFGWHALSAANRYYLDIDDISITTAPVCSTGSFPATVAATASKTTICSEEVINFNLNTAMPATAGITYQWKSSIDGITYHNTGAPAAVAAAALTASPTATYFKCDVFCSGALVLTSAPVAVTLRVLVLTTTPAQGCANTAIPLQATTQQGNTLKWYAAPNGGTALATGTTFNSPPVTTPTTYYVAAQGVVTQNTAGPVSPGGVSTSGYGGNSNGGEAMQFTLAEDINLTSVTIYPADPQPDNVIYLKDAGNNVINQLTFSTVGTSPVSGASAIGAPFVVTLNWNIPAGANYKLEWGVPNYYGTHRLLRNASGATALYNVANKGLTFTANTSSYGNGYWFYFYDWKFKSGCDTETTRVPVTATIKAEWTGTDNSNWSNPANWCGNTLPTAATNVVIPQTAHNPQIATGTAFANNLTVQPGATLNVNSGATLNVQNTLTTTGAMLTVHNNAALLQGSTVTANNNTGNITAIKNSNALYRLDYTLWSSPVAGQQLQAFSPQTTASRFYEYKYGTTTANTTAEQYFIVDNTTTFDTAKGYLIRMPNGGATTGYNTGQTPVSFEGVFTGTPNNGTINYTLSTQGNRYTAVGNPYPSPISVTDFFAENAGRIDASSALYFWRKRNNAAATSYAVLNAIAYVANSAAGGGTDQAAYYNGIPAQNWVIAPGQGFIVKTAAAPTSTTLTFTNSMRRAATQTQAFFRVAAPALSRYWLNLTNNNGSFSQTAIAYKDDATQGIDHGYDSEQLNDGNNLLLYSVVQNTPLAIQARPAFTQADVVALGFTAVTAGDYTLSLQQFDGLFSQDQEIYVYDDFLGTLQNLKESNYVFTTYQGTFNNRFSIVYTANALQTNHPDLRANNVIVYKQEAGIQIIAQDPIINVTVHSSNGKRLYNSAVNNTLQATVTQFNAQHEMLIITVTTTKGSVHKKIIF